MLKTILVFVGGLLETLALPILTYMKGSSDNERKHTKDANKRLSGRPRTDSDALSRLRAWRDKLKGKGK